MPNFLWNLFKRPKERLFVVGAGYEAGRPPMAWGDRLSLAGWNTGNLLIGNGLHRALSYDKWSWGRGYGADYICKNFDRIVLPVANLLRENRDIEPWAGIVEQINLPCLMIGLGAQAPVVGSVPSSIPESTIRIIRTIASRTQLIGVRGEYSANVARKLGIDNIEVVGCPSFYTNLRSAFRIKKKEFKDVRKIVITGSTTAMAGSYDPNLAENVERKLFHRADTGNFPYVLQSEKPEILFLEDPSTARKSSLRRQARLLGYQDVDEYASALRRVGRVFWNVEEWFGWIKAQDLVFGTRLHGAVAALLQNVPAIIVCIDARTKELCELMAFPHVSLQEAKEMSIEQIYERADFEKMNRRHEKMIHRYVKFLNQNDVSHRF